MSNISHNLFLENAVSCCGGGGLAIPAHQTPPLMSLFPVGQVGERYPITLNWRRQMEDFATLDLDA